MRLIDTDEFKKQEVLEKLRTAEFDDEIEDIIEKMPTAYDTNEIEGRLNELLLNLTFHKDPNSKTWNDAIHKAIKIVKLGINRKGL